MKIIFNNTKHLLAKAAYTGEEIKSYITQYPGEDYSKYKDRQNTVNYDGLIKPIIESLIDPVFAMGITRETKDIILTAYWADTNRLGDDINTVMRSVAVGKILHGNGFIITDNFKEFSSTSKGTQAENRELPWSGYRDMTELYAYTLNDIGIITEVEFYNGKNTKDKQMIIGYNSEFVYEYEKDKEKETVTAFPHGLTQLPVVTLNGAISETPALYDLCESNIYYLNKSSELSHFTRTGARLFLDFPTDDDIDTFKVKQFNIVKTDPNSSRGLNFVTPDASFLIGLQTCAKDAKTNITDQASRMGSVVSKAGSQSGEAYKMEFLGQSYKLKSLSISLQATEQDMIALVQEFSSIDFIYELEYPLDFVDPVSTKVAELTVIQSMTDLVKSLPDSIIAPTELTDYIILQMKNLST